MTVLFADVEGAAALLERLGQKRFDEVLARYEAVLLELAAEHDGRVETTAGEGRMLAFSSARGALRCAVALQRAVPTADGASFKPRVGLHSGDSERRDGELRGRVVVKAARIAGLARGGEVLASTLVRDIADLDDVEGDLWFDEPTEVELRGLRGSHSVAPVRWEERARPVERVVVADDSAIVRDGVAALLREHGLDVVATAADAQGLHDAVAHNRPDVAIVDIRMPPTFTNEGLVAAESIRRAYPDVAVLVLSQHVEPSYAARLLREGEERSGYLLKDRIADVGVLLEAIRRVTRGGCVVDPGLAERLVRSADAQGALADLSEREREILGLVAQGLSNRAIAERLVVSGRTVETHVGQVFLKLGLREDGAEHRRVAAVIAYLRATSAG